MAIQIGQLIAGQLPEGICFQSEQDRYNTFMRLAQVVSETGEIITQFFNYGNTTPDADNQAYPWLRLEADGSPDRWYVFFDGLWVAKHEIPANDARIQLWSGTTADVDTIDGGVAGPVTDTSGPFWEVVTAAAGRYPIFAGALPSGDATIAVNATGGVEKVTLTGANVPDHEHPIGVEDSSETVTAENGRLNADGADLEWQPGVSETRVGFTRGNNADGATPFGILPVYYGLIPIRRTARIYYTP